MPPGEYAPKRGVNVRPVRAIPQNLRPWAFALPWCGCFVPVWQSGLAGLVCPASRSTRCQGITCQSASSGCGHAAYYGENRGLIHNQRNIKKRANYNHPPHPAHQYYAQKGRAVIPQALAQKKARQSPKSPGHDGQAHSKPEKPGCGRKGQPADQKTARGEQNFVTQQNTDSRVIYAAPPKPGVKAVYHLFQSAHGCLFCLAPLGAFRFAVPAQGLSGGRLAPPFCAAGPECRDTRSKNPPQCR